MAKKKKSEDGKYEVGDHIKAKLHDGRVVHYNPVALTASVTRHGASHAIYRSYVVVRGLVNCFRASRLRIHHVFSKLGAGSLEEFQRLQAREREALESALNTVGFQRTNLDLQMQNVISAYGVAKQQKHGFTINWWGRRKSELTLVREFAEYQKQVALVAGAALDYLALAWAKHKEEAPGANVRGEIIPPTFEPANILSVCRSSVCC